MTFRLFSDLSREWEIEPESKNIIGFNVLDRDNNDVGEIQDLLVDIDKDNAINYAMIGKGWTESIFGAKRIIAPLRKLGIDQTDKLVHLDISRDNLRNFPDYAIDEPDFNKKVDSFWGAKMYRRPIKTSKRFGQAETIAVTEERLNIEREMEETGEVDITVREEIERTPIAEEVHGERVEVERHKVKDRPLSEYEQARKLQPGETLSIPVTEERLKVTKEPVVVEEIIIRRIPTTRQVTMEEDLHKEHVDIKEHKPGEQAA
jgi:stress response protein YsnF/sporulation protein YlmC with PRC-barrel domain